MSQPIITIDGKECVPAAAEMLILAKAVQFILRKDAPANRDLRRMKGQTFSHDLTSHDGETGKVLTRHPGPWKVASEEEVDEGIRWTFVNEGHPKQND